MDDKTELIASKTKVVHLVTFERRGRTSLFHGRRLGNFKTHPEVTKSREAHKLPTIKAGTDIIVLADAIQVVARVGGEVCMPQLVHVGNRREIHVFWAKRKANEFRKTQISRFEELKPPKNLQGKVWLFTFYKDSDVGL